MYMSWGERRLTLYNYKYIFDIDISLKIREVFYDNFVAIMIESVNYLSSVVNASF